MHKRRKGILAVLAMVVVFAAGIAGAVATTSKAAVSKTSYIADKCGENTPDISYGVDIVTAKGNLNATASFMGFYSYDGGQSSRLKHGLVIGEAAYAFTGSNTGCKNGRHVYVDQRTMSKSEQAAIRRPANLSAGQVCAPHARGCKPMLVRPHNYLPVSCWNGDTSAEAAFYIWVHQGKSPAKPKPVSKPKSKPKKALVRIIKIAEDDQGHQLPATPTGTFRFAFKCDGKVRTYVYNGPISALCTIGKRAEARELSPLSNEKWVLVSPKSPYLSMVVKKKGTMFVYKDQEVAPPVTVTTTVVTTTTTETTTTPAPKDGTQGAGAGTPGSGGGSGSGGSGGSGSGSVCRDPNTGDIVPGTPDQFGYCT